MDKVKVQQLKEGQYKIYWRKADEFYQTMKFAESKELWIAAGLLGIHCAISLCDAITTFYLGIRSKSQKHQDVAVLLKRIKMENINEKIKQVLSILSVKNLVEYEAREFRKDDSVKIITQVERLYRWTNQSLPLKEAATIQDKKPFYKRAPRDMAERLKQDL